MSHAIVYRWYARFRDENVESVRCLLTEDHHTTLQMIADRLNIGKETVRRIVTEDL